MTATALVTGANRGIGLEIARGLAQRGMKVILACRHEEEGIEARKDMVGGDIQVVEMDLSKPDLCGEAVVRAEAVYEGIDILVNNAGVLCDKPLSEVEVADFEQAFQVHVLSPLVLIQRVLPGMLERNFGRIINLTSGWGAFAQGMEGPPAYAVTKAALNALTVNVASTVGKEKNVGVNAVCPGWVHTRMGGTDAPLSPEQGADTVLWLAERDDAPNGQFFRKREAIDW